MSTLYQIVYWRDIPAQVKVRAGGQRLAHPLSQRFQEAIDEAAMLARATSTDAYLEDWHTSDWKPVQDEPENFTTNLLASIEAEYPPERLETLKDNKGYESS